MEMVFIICGFIILISVIILLIAKIMSQPVVPVSLQLPQLKNIESTDVENDKFWRRLNKSNQLELAIFIAEMALPVWDKYAISGQAKYTDISSMITKEIDTGLLRFSLQEIKDNTALLLSDAGHAKIDKYYNQFVGPVIALHDGDWVPPYAVKKVFLSCYNILKGIAENDAANFHDNFFTASIDNSLDCIDIVKMYTSDDVKGLLLNYRFSK